MDIGTLCYTARMKFCRWQFYFFAGLGFFVMVADGVIKRIVPDAMINGHLAWGIPLPFSPFVLLILLMLCAILFGEQSILAYRRGEWFSATAWLWLQLGTIGNFLDRWRLGGVVDYLPFLTWTKFNLSDTLIVAGIALLLLRERHGIFK